MDVAEFFQLPEDNLGRENVLKPNQIITAIKIPEVKAGTRSSYLKFREKQSLDFAISSVASVLEMQGDRVNSARIVLGGVAPIPWRVRKAEDELAGKTLSDTTIEKAAAAAVEGADPMSDNAYKVVLTRNLVRRALQNLKNA
jgi:xanthine dehydrogenase YagS FAD-binding subunit